MTDPKLREARIAEAKRRAEANIHNGRYDQNLASSLYDLIESDWRPEPEVDAVTLAAREWGALCEPFYRENYRMGRMDDEVHVQAFHAGHAHGQANCADVRRMDWLEGQKLSIEATRVKDDLHHYPNATPTLRAKIDRDMEGGE